MKNYYMSDIYYANIYCLHSSLSLQLFAKGDCNCAIFWVCKIAQMHSPQAPGAGHHLMAVYVHILWVNNICIRVYLYHWLLILISKLSKTMIRKIIHIGLKYLYNKVLFKEYNHDKSKKHSLALPWNQLLTLNVKERQKPRWWW